MRSFLSSQFGRYGIVALSLFFLVGATNLLTNATTRSTYSEVYPAVVCPPTLSGLDTAISLPSNKTKINAIGGASKKYKNSGTLRYMQKKAPLIIESGASTPLVWQVQKGIWAGATTCASPPTSQWFIGGTADVTSRGKLILINSGLSSAIGDVEIWSENGQQPSKVFTIKSNSYIAIGLDSLAPGSQSIAIHLTARTGRLSGYVLDIRGRGLKALGGDIVNSVGELQRDIHIPAVVHNAGKGNKAKALPHILRVLNPGEVQARIRVDLASTDGSFTPVGFENRLVGAGQVVDFELNPNLLSGKFALHISSDQEIAASVFSRTNALNKSDFTWSTSVNKLMPYSLATSGTIPQLVFTGSAIEIALEIFYSNGKRKSIDIRGEDIVTYQVPDNVRTITILKAGKDVYGAGLVATPSGYGVFPLNPGSRLTKASIPSSNIRVLTP